MTLPITEEWLKLVGFRWHQLERQPGRHWLLWLGGALDDGTVAAVEDLGIEVSKVSSADSQWHCWLRADYGRRYSRFIHLRHLTEQRELIATIEGITGKTFEPANNLYGAMHTEEAARRLREQAGRFDRILMREKPHSEIERDDSRGGALPEHQEAFVQHRLEGQGCLKENQRVSHERR
jgi:hypothetical protein